MSYMVIFQSPDGNAGYNQFEKLEGAVEFVETLRNEQGVENARMFDLKEIEFVMTPTWHVDMAAIGAGSPVAEAPSAPQAPAEPQAPVDVAPPVVEEAEVEVVEEQAAPPVDLTDTPAPTFEPPVAEEPLQEYAPPVAPEVPAAESFPPPPAPPASGGGPGFLPPPPMPPNEDVAPPAPEAPVAPEAPAAPEAPQRRGLFGR